MGQSLLQINRARFRSDLAALAGIGRDAQTQILARENDSEADRAAKLWLQRRVATAKLQAQADFEKSVVAALGPAQAKRAVVIVAETDSSASARPVLGSFALVAGLECLRCLQASEKELIAKLMLAPTTPVGTAQSASFIYAENELLRQAERLVGLEIRDGGTITMREICAMAQDCGIRMLPLPTTRAGQDQPGASLTYKFVLDPTLAIWPIEDWAALVASANLLLNFLYKFATAN